eukprot:GHVR01127862.1.p1 GENE.GHVR01127862.1~~GHVR01127862.1.p1  ORF type:complete len:400 (-),score=118.70 GHVR01127862.1:118-1317(-)
MISMGWDKYNYLIDKFPLTDKHREVWEYKRNDDTVLRCALFFDCYIQTGINRLLKRNTSIDSIEDIRCRYELFNKDTLPVVMYFQRIGLLNVIDSENECVDVGQECVARNINALNAGQGFAYAAPMFWKTLKVTQETKPVPEDPSALDAERAALSRWLLSQRYKSTYMDTYKHPQSHDNNDIYNESKTKNKYIYTHTHTHTHSEKNKSLKNDINTSNILNKNKKSTPVIVAIISHDDSVGSNEIGNFLCNELDLKYICLENNKNNTINNENKNMIEEEIKNIFKNINENDCLFVIKYNILKILHNIFLSENNIKYFPDVILIHGIQYDEYLHQFVSLRQGTEVLQLGEGLADSESVVFEIMSIVQNSKKKKKIHKELLPPSGCAATIKETLEGTTSKKM